MTGLSLLAVFLAMRSRVTSDLRSALLLIAAFCFLTGTLKEWLFWPLVWLLPLGVATLISWACGLLSDYRRVLRFGVMEPRIVAYSAAIALASAAGLFGWVTLLQPDLRSLTAQIPAWPVFMLIAAGATFSIANAFLEEFIWRGVFQGWLLSVFPLMLAIAIQAVSFGAAHYNGFPSGFVGILLATVYGAMLGALSYNSKGLAAPIAAHILADALIFTILANEAS
jgi:hypothetical protein